MIEQTMGDVQLSYHVHHSVTIVFLFSLNRLILISVFNFFFFSASLLVVGHCIK